MRMAATTALLAFAWFTAANLSISLAAWLAGALVQRTGIQGRPALLLGIRLLPASASLLIALALFVPAHWITEARDANETFGWVLYLLAGAGGALILRSARRAVLLARADRRLRTCERRSDAFPEVHEAEGVQGLALAGLLRTRILMGREVAASLTAAELDVAIAHETAHRRAVDNLKRWALHCAPDFFGACGTARKLERAWHAAAESIADDRAVGGDPRRALDLASALVKVARSTAEASSSVLTPVWSPFNDPALLERRVQRLLSDVPPAEPAARAGAGAAVGLLLLVITAPFIPLVPGAIHTVTEAAIAFLP